MDILVVDDNRDAVESLMEFLESSGHNVTPCFGGFEAIEEFSRHKFHLVLMDLKMPKMSGGETIKHIFELEPKARIVVLTGNTIAEDIEEVRKLGVVEIFRKPFPPEKILELIEIESAFSQIPTYTK